MAPRLLISTLILVLMSVVSSFPERKSSSLSGSRSVNGLRPNAIGGSMIYSVPINDQEVASTNGMEVASTNGMEVASTNDQEVAITNGMDLSSRTGAVTGEERSRKRSEEERRSEDEPDMFERRKRDPSGSSKSTFSDLYGRIVSCVRTGMGGRFVSNSNVRCAIKSWFGVFRVKERIRCKNCEPLMYCLANAAVHGECGHHHHGPEAASVISDCQELRVSSADASAEVIDEASVVGRDSGSNGCNNRYLCASGCRYSHSNETCDAVCH